MKLALPERQQQIALWVGVAVAVWLYLAFLVGPLWHKTSQLGQDMAGAKQKLALLESVTANEALVRSQHEQLSQTVQSLKQLLPAETELPNILALLSELAGKSDVKIQTIFPQRPVGSSPPAAKGAKAAGAASLTGYYKEVPIQIDAVGGYHQLGMFLSLVESSDKLLGLSSLRIAANPQDTKRHTFKLVITSYVAATDAKDTAAKDKPRT